LYISAVTRIELENGVWRDPAWAEEKRHRLAAVLEQVTTLDFSSPQIAAYGSIIAAAGFSKRKMVDRMTAATAIVADLPLVTFNGRDFRDVPGLQLIEWQRPDE
jgi:predicted nucleic acid-binding protein